MKPVYGNEFRAPPSLSMISPGLFMGGAQSSYEGYDLVVNCEEHLRKTPLRGWSGMLIHIPLIDDDELAIPKAAVDSAAEAVITFWKHKKTVLVHCTGGLNRSALVVARALMLSGFTADVAIKHLRIARDPQVLHNRHFEHWLRDQQPE